MIYLREREEIKKEARALQVLLRVKDEIEDKCFKESLNKMLLRIAREHIPLRNWTDEQLKELLELRKYIKLNYKI